MLMPFGIRLPHLQHLTAIGSKYMSGIIPVYVRTTDNSKKAMDNKFGARVGSDDWLGCFREAKAVRWGATTLLVHIYICTYVGSHDSLHVQ